MVGFPFVEMDPMSVFARMALCSAAAIAVCGASSVFAQGELKYDPDKGFMVIDEKDKTGKSAKSIMSAVPKEADGSPRMAVPLARESADIQVGRKKDPPTLYFMSGQEYYKNGDFTNALKDFRYADSVGPKPVYKLWVGKTFRSLGQFDKMLKIMNDIVKKTPESDVADDALLEMAVYYQNDNDYETAIRLYSQIAEQYPFAVSYTSGENLIEVVRELRKQLNAQLSSQLAMMGFSNEEISACIADFQKSRGLPVTGNPDKATVQLIKKARAKLLESDQNRENDDALARKHRLFVQIAGAIGLMNILIATVLLFRARGKANHAGLLAETLSDLDTRKI